MPRPLLVASLLFALTLTAAAQQEVWVDPILGDDAHGGTGPDDAWASLAHALDQVQQLPAPRTVNVMPGVLGAANGEVFPLVVAAGTRVVSTDGAAVTRIAPPGTPSVIVEMRVEPAAEAALVGLTIVGGDTGVRIKAVTEDAVGTARLEDLVVEDATSLCVDFWRDTSVVAEGCLLQNSEWACMRGKVSGATDGRGVGYLEMRDCTIRGSVYWGLVLVWLYEGSFRATLERCRITDSGSTGIFLVENGHSTSGFDNEFVFDNCIVVGSGAGGILCERGSCDVRGCTIADNGPFGVSGATRLLGTIVDGHVDDIEGNPVIDHCLVGDGDGAGSNGNLTGDPSFVDRAAGDWRLTFASPCVDSGHADVGPIDARGLSRGTDGDLDLEGASDIGALELQTLTAPGVVTVGKSFSLGLQGPVGATSVVFVDHGGLGTGMQTPFGRVFLSPAMRRLVAVQIQGGAPTRFEMGVAPYHGIGSFDFSLQALVDSPLAPAGKAWSNPTVVHVE